MNAAANDVTTSSMRLAPAAPDCTRLAQVFQQTHHVRIPDVLDEASALLLYRHLAGELPWRTFLLARSVLYSARPGPLGSYGPELEAQMKAKAHEGARHGFVSIHEADRLFPEDIPPVCSLENPGRSALLDECLALLNSPAFLDICRTVTGFPDIVRADIQATRFRPGHFVTLHRLRPYLSSSEVRVAAFEINLTLEWQPEWGGLYEINRGHDYLFDSCMPSFNLLDLFSVQHAQWISPVSAFARGERLAIAGWLYERAEESV